MHFYTKSITRQKGRRVFLLAFLFLGSLNNPSFFRLLPEEQRRYHLLRHLSFGQILCRSLHAISANLLIPVDPISGPPKLHQVNIRNSWPNYWSEIPSRCLMQLGWTGRVLPPGPVYLILLTSTTAIIFIT